MIPRLTPAELRTAVRLMAIYTEATAHILAEEEAAEALAVPTGDDMVAARRSDLTATPEARARFAAYLDGLEVTHGDDPAMAAHIRRQRDWLADTPPASTTSDFTSHAARLDRSPQVAAATEGDPSRG